MCIQSLSFSYYQMIIAHYAALEAFEVSFLYEDR